MQRGKPDPQIFLVAAGEAGRSAPRAIVVEDAPAGVAAARNAGMRVIGVRTGHGDLEADLVVDTLADLPHRCVRAVACRATDMRRCWLNGPVRSRR